LLFLILTTILSSISVFCISAAQAVDEITIETENVVIEHDLEIGLATISFENIKIDNIEQPILKKAIKNTEQTIGLPATFIEKLHAGGTVLFLKDHKIGHCEIGIDFIDGGFYVANIIYDSLSIEWDDFLGPAWYVRG